MDTQQHTCDINQLLKTFDALIQLSQASFDYQLLLADIWVKAFSELTRELASYQAKGKAIKNLRQFWKSGVVYLTENLHRSSVQRMPR